MTGWTARVRRWSGVGASLALAVGLTACTEEEAPPRVDGFSVVIGARDNMPASNLRGISAARAEAAVHWEALLSVVVADGASFQHVEATRLPVNENNPVSAQKDRDRNLGHLAAQLSEARARTPETDLLSALGLAARSISAADAPRTIVVVDSGLSTAGALDFTQPGVLEADPDELAAQLEQAGQLPDLSGVEVILQGIGDTAPTQPRLGEQQRKNLERIWDAVVRAAGADDVLVEQSPIQAPPPADVPEVSPVPVADGGTCTVETVELDGGEVAFEPESASFVDRDAALVVLRRLAERIVAEGFAVRLAGTTADIGDLDGQRRLSLERAEAVRAELAGLGVPADRMTAEGLGSQHAGHIEDHDANGDPVPALAAANRRVLADLQRTGSVVCA